MVTVKIKNTYKLSLLSFCALIAIACAGDVGVSAQGLSPATTEFLQGALERGARVPIVPTTQLPSGKVTLDGNVSEWATAEDWPRQAAFLHQGLWQHLTTPYDWGRANKSPLPSPPVATKTAALNKPQFDVALMRLAFDNDALYFAARVADETLITAPQGAALETGDAVAIALDLRSALTLGDLGARYMDPWGGPVTAGLFGLVVAPGDTAALTTSMPPVLRPALRQMPFGVFQPIVGSEVASRRSNGGYEVEVRIPFSELRAGTAQPITSAQLHRSIGVQFHVFDRDQAVLTQAAATSATTSTPNRDSFLQSRTLASSYTWTRDERANYSDRMRGEAWGITRFVETPNENQGTTLTENSPVADPIASEPIEIQLSPSQLQGERLFWRAAIFWKGVQPAKPAESLEGELKERLTFKADASSRLASPRSPTSAESSLFSALFLRSLQAKQAEWKSISWKIISYPNLNLTVAYGDLEALALPPARYNIRLSVGSRSAVRGYLVTEEGLTEYLPGGLGDAPSKEETQKWLQEAYWSLPVRAARSVGQPLFGRLIPYFRGSDNLLRLSQLANAGQPLSWGVRLELFPAKTSSASASVPQEAANTQGAAAPKEGAVPNQIPATNNSPQPETKAIWQHEIPLSIGGTTFEIPANLLPIGAYQLKRTLLQRMPNGSWSVMTPQPATMVPVDFEVSAPRQAVWKASVIDSPALLRHWKFIGSPSRERFSRLSGLDAQARGVRDLQWFDGRIYTGDADIDHNRGPSNIWSFAPPTKPEAVRKADSTNKPKAPSKPTGSKGVAPQEAPQEVEWRKDATINEEGIELFRTGELNGKKVLIIPGVDPADGLGESKDLGNCYIKKSGSDQEANFGWIKRRSIPKSGWTNDVQSWRGRLYATTESGEGQSRIQVSDDEGVTWSYLEANSQFKEAGPMPDIGGFTGMAPLASGLLFAGWDGDKGVLIWDGNVWRQQIFDLRPNNILAAGMARLTPFSLPENPDGLLYTFKYGEALPLCFLPSLSAAGAQIIEPFEKAQVRDILTRDGVCYVLTGERRQPKMDEYSHLYDGAIYSSRDLKSWTRLAAFETSALPNALEVASNQFYVGLHSSRDDDRDIASGDVLCLQP